MNLHKLEANVLKVTTPVLYIIISQLYECMYILMIKDRGTASGPCKMEYTRLALLFFLCLISGVASES